MITNKLYEQVLIEPLETNKVDELYIVSGYATAAFTKLHLDETISLNNPKINLIIGMPRKKNDHIAFVELHKEFDKRFKGYYLDTQPPVHSKVYSWCCKSKGVVGFSGSSNYSQYGFIDGSSQINQMNEDDPTKIKFFFDKLLKRSKYIPEAKNVLADIISIPSIEGRFNPGTGKWIEENKSARISFLTSNGILPVSSGLNWGHRPIKRELNQAYLPIRGDAKKEGFLPGKKFTFTLITDDGVPLDCRMQQDERKAISTTNNSILGKYIRKRIGVPEGGFVKKEHLENYGRTDFVITKLDDETFTFDFSV